MERALTLTKTTIGKKVLMALSGIMMLGFSVGHLSGNLKAFASAQAFNDYAAWLRTMPTLLWAARIGLLVAFGVHIASAASLWARNRAARPNRYAKKKDLATDYAAKTMYWSGPILFFYIIFHLAHLTLGGAIFGDSAVFGIEGYTFDPHNPYNNMVKGFQYWPLVVVYALGVVSLATHLFHGIWSMFQTLGANHKRYNPFRRDVAIGLAVLLGVGFLSIPIAVQAELLEPTNQAFYYPELDPNLGD